MPTDRPKSVFLSYAREDEDHRDVLVQHLKAVREWARPDDIWHDGRIEGGADWESEILGALRRSDLVIFLLSEHLLKSTFVREVEIPEAFEREQRGACAILPVQLSDCDWSGSPFSVRQLCPSGAPILSRSRHDRNASWAKVANLVRHRLGQPGDPSGDAADPSRSGQPDRAVRFIAPTPRQRLVERPDLLQNLVRLLIDVDSSRLMAVVGMAGVGKSTMARAVVEHRLVLERFPDGAVWVELGCATPSDAQSKVAAGLGASQPINDVGAGRELLRALVADGSFLIVLDDVWGSEQLDALDLGDGASRVLVTTRDRGVVPDWAALHEVELTDDTTSTAILACWANTPLEQLPAEAGEVIASSGGLPFALAIAGGAVSAGRSWHQVLTSIREDAHSPGGIFDPVQAAFDIGVDSLPTEVRDQYLALTVLAGNGGEVPESVVNVLWQESEQDELDTEQQLVNLARRSLLRYDAMSRTASMHALQIRCARARLTAARQQELHAKLARAIIERLGGMDRCLPRLRASTAQDDPVVDYALEELVGHLLRGHLDVLAHQLLWLSGPVPGHREPTNVWFALQEQRGRMAAYLRDVETLWRAAESATDRAKDSAEPVESVALEARYALITSSIARSAANWGWLITAAVEAGLWTADQALAYAGTLRDGRCQALADLVPHLPEQQRHRVAEETLALAAGESQTIEAARLLRQLDPWIGPRQRSRYMERMLAIARAIDNPVVRGWALQDVADALPVGPSQRAVLEESLACASTPTRGTGMIDVPYRRANIMSRLAATLQPPDQPAMYRQALAEIRRESGSELRCGGLIELAAVHHGPESSALLNEALDVARSEKDGWARCRILVKVAEHLKDPQREQVLAEAFTLRQRIREGTWLDPLDDLLRVLPERLLPQVRQIVHVIEDHDTRSGMLVALAKRLSGADRQQVIGEAIDAARKISRLDARRCGQGLASVANCLDGDRRLSLLAEAIDTARSLRDHREQAVALAGLAAQLPAPEAASVADDVLALARGEPGPATLQSVAGYLTGLPRRAAVRESLDRIAADGRTTGVDLHRQLADLARLAPLLPTDLVPDALTLLDRLVKPHIRWSTTIAVRLKLSEGDNFRTAFRGRTRVLASLPTLPTRRIVAVLPFLALQPDMDFVDTGLRHLLAQLDDRTFASEAKKLTAGIENQLDLHVAAVALSELASRGAVLPIDWLVTEVSQIDYPDTTPFAVLVALAPNLPPGTRARVINLALDAARNIAKHDDRARALARISRHLPAPDREPILVEAMQVARAADSHSRSVIAVAEAAQELLADSWVPYWRPALREVSQTGRGPLLDALARAAAGMATAGGLAAVRSTLCAVREVVGWFP